jgi:hypothetical protein
VAGCCECGDEPSGSCPTELVTTAAISQCCIFLVPRSKIPLRLTSDLASHSEQATEAVHMRADCCKSIVGPRRTVCIFHASRRHGNASIQFQAMP